MKNVIRKILKKVIKVFFFLVFVAFAVSLILIGLYYSKISQKQYIFGTMIDQAFDKTNRIFSIDSDYLLGDSFFVEGTLKMDLSSEDYRNKSLTDIEYGKKVRMLENLSLMNTTYQIGQKKDNGRVFASLHETIGEEEIFSGKYYIEDSTRYIFVNGILSNYVNDGAANYFESYQEEATTLDNIDYLYTFIRDSIKNNITEEELNGYDVETLVGEDTIQVGQISYKITDKSYKELLSRVLKDLKKDPRAHQILSVAYPNLDDLKVDEKKKYLKGNESYTISVYVSKPFFHPVKYEVVYLKDDQKEIYTYEGDLKDGTFYYSLNNLTKYRATYHSTSKRMTILVYDQFNNQIGTIKGEKDKNSLMLMMTLDLDKKKYDVTYTMKNKDLENNSYKREDVLSFKIMDDMITILQGNVEVNSNITGSAKIEEDVSSSVLRSTLSEEESSGLDTLRDKIKNRLET